MSHHAGNSNSGVVCFKGDKEQLTSQIIFSQSGTRPSTAKLIGDTLQFRAKKKRSNHFIVLKMEHSGVSLTLLVAVRDVSRKEELCSKVMDNKLRNLFL